MTAPDRETLAAALERIMESDEIVQQSPVEGYWLAVADALLAGPLAPVAPAGDGGREFSDEFEAEHILAAVNFKRLPYENALRVTTANVARIRRQARAAGRADERAAAVADLDMRARECASAASQCERVGQRTGANFAWVRHATLKAASERIERGEHLGD